MATQKQACLTRSPVHYQLVCSALRYCNLVVCLGVWLRMSVIGRQLCVGSAMAHSDRQTLDYLPAA
jgi:formate/nitrite transporter FocA (FNT family)